MITPLFAAVADTFASASADPTTGPLLWTQSPPNPGPLPLPPGLAEFGNNIIGWLKTIALIVGVVMMLASGIMVIVGRRNRNQFAQDGLIGSVWVVGGLALIGSAAAIVGAIPIGG